MRWAGRGQRLQEGFRSCEWAGPARAGLCGRGCCPCEWAGASGGGACRRDSAPVSGRDQRGRGFQEGLRPGTSSPGILAPPAMRKLLHPKTRQGSQAPREILTAAWDSTSCHAAATTRGPREGLLEWTLTPADARAPVGLCAVPAPVAHRPGVGRSPWQTQAHQVGRAHPASPGLLLTSRPVF